MGVYPGRAPGGARCGRRFACTPGGILKWRCSIKGLTISPTSNEQAQPPKPAPPGSFLMRWGPGDHSTGGPFPWRFSALQSGWVYVVAYGLTPRGKCFLRSIGSEGAGSAAFGAIGFPKKMVVLSRNHFAVSCFM